MAEEEALDFCRGAASFSDIAVRRGVACIESGEDPAMTMHVLQFVELSDRDCETAEPLGKLGRGDRVEVLVRRMSGGRSGCKVAPEG
jgi:hypothetical protein